LSFLLGLIYIIFKSSLLVAILKSGLSDNLIYCFIFMLVLVFLNILERNISKKELIKEVILNEKNKME
jgi:hypothetical protein